METAAVRKLHPSRYEEATPCVYHDVTKVVPKNQPPIDRYAQGRSKRPDHPMNTKRSLFNQSSRTSNQPLVGCRSVDANGKIVPTWGDVLNRANLGMEVMHERNAHNFPLDLASAESTQVALTAPTIG